MAQVWNQVTLSEVCNFQNGFAFKNSDYVEEGDGAFEIFRMGNIVRGGGFNADGKKVLVTGEQAQKLKRFISNAGDVLMCMTDMKGSMALLGHTARMPVSGRYLVNQRVGRITVKNTELLDSMFLYYYSNSPEYIEWLRAHANSGVQVNLSTEAILKSPIKLPTLQVQRRIAGILSAYDDLIENCQRRIQILEEMARSLYREWFVNFRYPGHESVPLVPSALGEIPQGWDHCALGDFVQFQSGFAFKSGQFVKDGEHRLVTIKNVQDGSFNPNADSRLNDIPGNLPAHCLLADGDILLSLTGNVGRVCVVFGGSFLLNQRVAKLKPVDAQDWAMAYSAFRQPEMLKRLEMLSNGVAQQNLSPIAASKTEFVRPPKDVRHQFALLVEPMLQKVVILFNTIQNLRETRDLLLPRLMSGQLEVTVD